MTVRGVHGVVGEEGGWLSLSVKATKKVWTVYPSSVDTEVTE
jgi:hypothetical protein